VGVSILHLLHIVEIRHFLTMPTGSGLFQQTEISQNKLTKFKKIMNPMCWGTKKSAI
jgi:hypothetical protein